MNLRSSPVGRGIDTKCERVRVPRPSPFTVHLATPSHAFTLLEVMIAVAVFFIAVFAILDLTSRCLRSARALQAPRVDASSLAAELSLTNRLVEGVESGDFGDLYRGYTWSRETRLEATNGLYRVDFSVFSPSGKSRLETTMSLLLFRPDSVAGARGRTR